MKDYFSKALTGVEEGAESVWDMVKNSPEFAAGLYHTLRDHPSTAIKELGEGALRDIAQTGIGAAKFVARSMADPLPKEAQKYELVSAPRGTSEFVDQLLNKAEKGVAKHLETKTPWGDVGAAASYLIPGSPEAKLMGLSERVGAGALGKKLAKGTLTRKGLESGLSQAAYAEMTGQDPSQAFGAGALAGAIGLPRFKKAVAPGEIRPDITVGGEKVKLPVAYRVGEAGDPGGIQQAKALANYPFIRSSIVKPMKQLREQLGKSHKDLVGDHGNKTPDELMSDAKEAIFNDVNAEHSRRKSKTDSLYNEFREETADMPFEASYYKQPAQIKEYKEELKKLFKTQPDELKAGTKLLENFESPNIETIGEAHKLRQHAESLRDSLSKEPKTRQLASIFGKARDALDDSIETSIENSGDESLIGLHDQAKKARQSQGELEHDDYMANKKKATPFFQAKQLGGSPEAMNSIKKYAKNADHLERISDYLSDDTKNKIAQSALSNDSMTKTLTNYTKNKPLFEHLFKGDQLELANEIQNVGKRFKEDPFFDVKTGYTGEKQSEMLKGLGALATGAATGHLPLVAGALGLTRIPGAVLKSKLYEKMYTKRPEVAGPIDRAVKGSLMVKQKDGKQERAQKIAELKAELLDLEKQMQETDRRIATYKKQRGL